MRLRTWAWSVGLGLGAVVGAGCERLPETPRPRNVLLISIDTVRQDVLTGHGGSRAVSPAIGLLTGAGTRFSAATAASPWTLPSHASMLSGLYPHRHRVRHHESALPEDVHSLPALLSEASFATGAVVSAELLGRKHGFERGFRDFLYVPEWAELPDGDRFLANPGTEVTDRALEWLAGRTDEPFFLFLHYYDAHSDYVPADAYREELVDPYDGRADGSTGQLLAVRSGDETYDAEDAAHLKQLYEAEIRELDDQLARLFAFLDESGLADSTLVVLTSDHGEEFLEHGSVLHGRTYYDEVIRVPLVLRGPGVPAGRVVDVPASHVDLVPTVLDLLGLPVPEDVQGVSLVDAWRAPETWTRTAVIAEADWQNRLPETYWMIRTSRYKLVVDWREGTAELYDLDADPAESNDLAVAEPELVEALTAELERRMQAYRTGETPVEVTEEELERLRGLGYTR